MKIQCAGCNGIGHIDFKTCPICGGSGRMSDSAGDLPATKFDIKWGDVLKTARTVAIVAVGAAGVAFAVIKVKNSGVFESLMPGQPKMSEIVKVDIVRAGVVPIYGTSSMTSKTTLSLTNISQKYELTLNSGSVTAEYTTTDNRLLDRAVGGNNATLGPGQRMNLEFLGGLLPYDLPSGTDVVVVIKVNDEPLARKAFTNSYFY